MTKTFPDNRNHVVVVVAAAVAIAVAVVLLYIVFISFYIVQFCSIYCFYSFFILSFFIVLFHF